jgi:hypothetical protein
VTGPFVDVGVSNGVYQVLPSTGVAAKFYRLSSN